MQSATLEATKPAAVVEPIKYAYTGGSPEIPAADPRRDRDPRGRSRPARGR